MIYSILLYIYMHVHNEDLLNTNLFNFEHFSRCLPILWIPVLEMSALSTLIWEYIQKYYHSEIFYLLCIFRNNSEYRSSPPPKEKCYSPFHVNLRTSKNHIWSLNYSRNSRTQLKIHLQVFPYFLLLFLFYVLLFLFFLERVLECYFFHIFYIRMRIELEKFSGKSLAMRGKILHQ